MRSVYGELTIYKAKADLLFFLLSLNSSFGRIRD